MRALRIHHLLLALALPCASVLGGPARAANGDAFLFQWDNDKVADTDRHFTNGMRIAYTFGTPSGQWATTARKLAGLTWFTDQSALRPGWTIGQDMYTPEDVDASVPDPLDRPYAGWSYLGFTVQNEAGRVQDTLELNAGVIGPASHAAQTQNAFHRLINVSVSRGWRSQIHNEPGLLATRTVKLRSQARTPFGPDWLETDAIGHATAQLGNVRSGAALGATVRVGGNLEEDFGPVFGAFALPHKRPENVTYSLFLGGEARAVAWDVFLDGNTFKDSPDVKKKPYVMEGRLGFVVHAPLPDGYWANGARLSVNLVSRTREFQTQNKADRYGSLQVTLNF